jgi:hypothetical protein
MANKPTTVALETVSPNDPLFRMYCDVRNIQQVHEEMGPNGHPIVTYMGTRLMLSQMINEYWRDTALLKYIA